MTHPGSDVASDVRAAFAEEAAELLRRTDSALREAAEAADRDRAALWLEALRSLHTLKGAAAAAGNGAVKTEAHSLEERVRGLQSGAESVGERVSEELFACLDRIRELLRRGGGDGEGGGPASVCRPSGPETSKLDAEASPMRAGAEEHLRVRPERVDALHARLGELSFARLEYEALTSRIAVLRERLAGAVTAGRRLTSHMRSLRRHLPLPQWRTANTALEDLASSLGVAFQEAFAASRQAPMLQAHTATVITALEDGIGELRLMPLHPFFEGYAQAVREAARECGKKARIEIRAEGAEMDRAVLVRLRDALLHLVRNGVVHGIEPPEARRAAGKAESGTVLLEARCEGARAVIRVVDDGGGIDLERVRRKALQVGLIDESRSLDDDAVLDLLVQPGFSTRDAADALAGRGIGLDVVASAVRGLGGQLRLDNLPGAGCVFSLEVPITASTAPVLLVQSGKHRFGILLRHVERALRVAPDDVILIEGRAAVDVGGDPLALLTLAEVLDLPAAAAAPGPRPGVVLRWGQRRLVVTVDDIPGEQTMVVKPLNRAFRGAGSILGGAIQADDTVVPVLQVAAIFDRAAALKARHREAGGETVRPPQKRTVLVVDDSITMRSLQRNILQAAGFEVAMAHDGVSASEEFARLAHCDLIVTDLQMPRMDGVGLCQAVRGSDRPHTPILVVTAVGDPDERRRALAAGADAYIVKADFERGRFLAVVEQLAGVRARP